MNCKNCKSQIQKDSDYCASCGAKVIRNRLTLKNLFASFSEQFLDYDNKFLQTFINLFTRPEDVIGSYIDGTRKKYVNAVSFFAITLTISGLYLFFVQKYFPDFMDASSIYEDEAQQKITKEISQFSFEYNSLLYFILIPIIALMSRIVFYDKKYNLTEHTVIYLYSLSFWSLFSSLFNAIVLLIYPEAFIWVSLVVFFLMFVYHGYILKRIFSLNARGLIIKTLIFLPLFFISYIGISIVILIIVLITGDYSLQDFAPKK
ncbi:MAG: DUF3667 domain-containing protein [Bacteroidia bacterium]|nr:DUF3667 domain-containing protein [Bacteroidia bacterium]MBT8311187.1 DUF3667 domain-containing protein [Bacteroidia bacterium]NND11892.1 DUF3667 domain-containing protein [Flavobacteriaceae bacterium]NNL61862.1 DUF3667 domain-containing protein [Flavobacteriaceae bacterium]